MPGDKKEPQSYGSNADWVTGKTGQQVNDQAGEPAPEHADFYDDRRESEESTSYQGGKVSPVQRAEAVAPQSAAATHPDSDPPAVAASEGGTKRDSFFRKRDYE
jgi:hypothetical protein